MTYYVYDINTSIMATVHPLPHIEVYLQKHVSWEEKATEKLIEIQYKTCRLCEKYRMILGILVLCLCVGSIGISVMLKDTNIGPCYYYTSETLASDVSIECVKYLWNVAQCPTVLESSSTWHWWIQSPQGLTTIKCDASHKGTLCGAGSYATIRNYIQLCNPYYGQ
jgi:hypothetical protein